MDDLTLHKGGQSAMWGSGAIGGVINLNQSNQLKGNFLLENQVVHGSFGRWEEKFKLGFRAKNLSSVSSVSYLKAQNDYPFIVGKDIIRILANAPKGA